jgi:5'(3')-deoxyribonucleotidase
MSFENLTNENIMMYAVKAYDKPNCIMSEFKDDMKRFNYLKRLLKRYRKIGEIRERLILNHLLVLYNVFGVEVATRLLFYKIPKEDYSVLKTYLIFLNFMPNMIVGIKGHNIISSDISIDMNIANELRKIK